MTIQTIPLKNLTPSTANVRKTGASFGIDELAASITAHGLLQNLQVRPSTTGRFEVVAGGRRLAALKALAKHKQIAKDFEAPCHVRRGSGPAITVLGSAAPQMVSRRRAHSVPRLRRSYGCAAARALWGAAIDSTTLPHRALRGLLEV